MELIKVSILPNQMDTPESRPHRIIRRIVAISLIIETAVLSPIACFLLIFIPLMGGMASIYGAGNVSDEQFKKTWWFIGLLSVAPLMVTIALAIASVQILQNKRPMLAIAACGLFIVAYLSEAHAILDGDWSKFTFTASIPVLIPLAGILLQIKMRK